MRAHANDRALNDRALHEAYMYDARAGALSEPPNEEEAYQLLVRALATRSMVAFIGAGLPATLVERNGRAFPTWPELRDELAASNGIFPPESTILESMDLEVAIQEIARLAPDSKSLRRPSEAIRAQVATRFRNSYSFSTSIGS
jgi:hypothetical protein